MQPGYCAKPFFSIQLAGAKKEHLGIYSARLMRFSSETQTKGNAGYVQCKACYCTRLRWRALRGRAGAHHHRCGGGISGKSLVEIDVIAYISTRGRSSQIVNYARAGSMFGLSRSTLLGSDFFLSCSKRA